MNDEIAGLVLQSADVPYNALHINLILHSGLNRANQHELVSPIINSQPSIQSCVFSYWLLRDGTESGFAKHIMMFNSYLKMSRKRSEDI